MKIKICVVGLGYVGLPLAIEFAKVFDTVGFDVNKKKVTELKKGIDRMNETPSSILKKTKLKFTTDEKEISNCNFIVVAVPTPIDEAFKPDLKYVRSASEIVGKNLSKGSIIVY